MVIKGDFLKLINLYQTMSTYETNHNLYKVPQYPIIRNGDQSWALEFLKNFQFPDADRFLILQGWALAVS